MATDPVDPPLPLNLAEARKAFKDLRVVHTGSTLPDGTAHVVPLWFVWLEDGLVVSARAGSRVYRNLFRDPRVALELDRGRAWTEHMGLLIKGLAEPLSAEEPAMKRALSAWFEKYREELAGSGFAVYTEQVRRPAFFRVRPDRVSSWSHAVEEAR
jgi:nitroimidazol reductase NimA-like FMN-containing flavoprotein (pyridoxamine 5'-phosphate oxidase superfamily)